MKIKEEIMKKRERIIFLIAIVLIIAINYHNTDAKLFSNASAFNRILPLFKSEANSLDEVRWSKGEVILTGTNITDSGFYVLGKGLEDEFISIDADAVYVDLNGYQIYDSTGTATAIIIEDGHQDIVIKNGSLKSVEDSTGIGILLNPNSSLVLLQDLQLSNFNTGIYLDGNQTGTIKACKCKNCMLKEHAKAVKLNYTYKCVFDNCNAFNCTKYGFELQNSELNYFHHCNVLETTNDDPEIGIFGFSSVGGQANIFNECTVNGMSKEESHFDYNATGFYFGPNDDKEAEQKSEIVNCIVNDITISGTGNGYGVQFDFTLNDSLTLATSLNNITDDINAIAWSPESKFLAIGASSAGLSTLSVYTFNQTTGLQLVTTDQQDTGNIITALAWSHKGSYLAVGAYELQPRGQLDFLRIYIYEFDTSTGTLGPSPLTTFVDSARRTSPYVYSLVWSHDDNYLAAGLDVPISNNNTVPQIKLGEFNNNNLIIRSTLTQGSSVTGVSFSPDDTFLAAVYSTDLEVFKFNPSGTTNTEVLDSQVNETLYGGDLQSVDFSPIACNAKYLLAVGGDQSSNQSVQVVEYNGDTTVSSINIADHGADVSSVQWAPNGKSVLACGEENSSNNEISIFPFDGSQLLTPIEASHDEEVNQGVWSPSGRYIGVVGDDNPEVSIFLASDPPSKCAIKNSEFTNCTGGLCGIGAQAASGENLIIRNIAYANDINFSDGIFNKFIGRLTGEPGRTENISVQAYDG